MTNENETLLIEDGVVVKCIDSYARNVVIPDGVTEIGFYSFTCCEFLSTVEIPKGVIEISAGAFSGCESLSSVVIPEGVVYIGLWAFQHCESLSTLVLPASIKAIGGEAFDWCDSLEKIEFGGTMAQWEAVQKDSCWIGVVPAKVVKCSDGEVAL